MKYFAVIDTNVIISAMLNFRSVPGQIVLEALTGKITPLLNNEILDEYEEVLSRPKFHFSQNDIEILINGIVARGIHVDATPLGEYLLDPKDTIFYEIVMESRKTTDSYLVTGNLKHFPVKPFIITPREMLNLIQDE